MMRNIGLAVIVGAIGLGALLFWFWGGDWTKGDVKKAAGAAREKIAQIKEDAQAAVQAATA